MNALVLDAYTFAMRGVAARFSAPVFRGAFYGDTLS
jgi:hypothetical protein